MICPNCGHNVREGAKFCDECGIVLPAAPANAAKSSPTAGSFVAARTAEASAPAATGNRPDAGGASGVSMLSPSMDGGGRRIVAIVAGIAALLLCCSCIACAALFWYATNQPPAFLQ